MLSFFVSSYECMDMTGMTRDDKQRNTLEPCTTNTFVDRCPITFAGPLHLLSAALL